MFKSTLFLSFLLTATLFGANTKSGVKNYTATSITSPASNALTLKGTTTVGIQTYNSGWQDRVTVTNGGAVGIGITPDLGGYGSTSNVLTVGKYSSAGQFGVLELGGYRTDDGVISDLNFYMLTSGGAVTANLNRIRNYRDGANNSTSMGFLTTNAGTASEKMRIAPDGTTTFNTGIKLPNTGGGTVTTLNTYAEGTCSFAASGATGFTTTSCGYTKIGRLVKVDADITFSSVSSASDINFSGLPFNSHSSIGQTFNCEIFGDTLNHATTGWRFNMGVNTTVVDWDKYTFSTGTAVNVANTDLASSGFIRCHFTYITN